jgi:CTP-dependent riboflavin kinase
MSPKLVPQRDSLCRRRFHFRLQAGKSCAGRSNVSAHRPFRVGFVYAVEVILRGEVVGGCGHFKVRMATYQEVFTRATGEHLHPGTINVNVGEEIQIREEFRIKGTDINEPDQDLLFERCRINGHAAYRIRPYHIPTGSGGHGDHILEIACCELLHDTEHGKVVEIELFDSVS